MEPMDVFSWMLALSLGGLFMALMILTMLLVVECMKDIFKKL